MKKKKNILIFLPFFSLGGAETQAFILADHLNQSDGFQVQVGAFLEKDSKLISRLDEHKIAWRLYPFNLSLLSNSRFLKYYHLIKLAFSIRRENFDVIIPFTYYPNIVINFVWKLTGAKISFWNQRGLEVTMPVSKLEQLAQISHPKYISNSHAGKDFLIKRHNIHPEKITVINNGYYFKLPKKDRNNWREELNIGNDNILLIMVANFFTEKDHKTVLKSFYKLLQTNKQNNFKLLFVGNSPTELAIAKAKALTYDLSLSDSVLFIESNDDIPGLIHASDIGILSSFSEGCPNSILEYMLAKLPVIATKIPGIIETLGEDYEYLFNINDDVMLYELISVLGANELLRTNIGQRNYERVQANYSPNKMCSEYISLLYDI